MKRLNIPYNSAPRKKFILLMNAPFFSGLLNKQLKQIYPSMQVGYPINPHSIGGWKSFKTILQPEIEILNRSKNNYKE